MAVVVSGAVMSGVVMSGVVVSSVVVSGVVTYVLFIHWDIRTYILYL